MFEFQNLEVYKKAKVFHQTVIALFPENSIDRITSDQLTRASLSIAEGSGRFSKPDRRNFFVIARGSVFECVAVLDILHDKKLIASEKFTELLKLADELSRILYAMIKNLESK